MQHCTKFQGRALVDGHTQEDKSYKATTQQCTATHPVSNRDLVLTKCDLDALLHDAFQGPRLRTTQRLEPVD
jgi:hypothetical protein